MLSRLGISSASVFHQFNSGTSQTEKSSVDFVPFRRDEKRRMFRKSGMNRFQEW